MLNVHVKQPRLQSMENHGNCEDPVAIALGNLHHAAPLQSKSYNFYTLNACSTLRTITNTIVKLPGVAGSKSTCSAAHVKVAEALLSGGVGRRA